MFTRNCPQCDSIIDYNHEHTKNKAEQNNTRCASCRNHRNLKPNCECKVCKKELYRRPSRLNQDNIFCSYGCRNKYFSGDRGKHKPKPKRNRSWDQKSVKNKLSIRKQTTPIDSKTFNDSRDGVPNLPFKILNFFLKYSILKLDFLLIIGYWGWVWGKS